MTEREKIYKGLAACTNVYAVCKDCPYREQRRCQYLLMDDVLNLLKEQKGYVTVPFSWLAKFCTHIDFKEPMTDKERELLWKQKLKQQFGIDIEESEVKYQ